MIDKRKKILVVDDEEMIRSMFKIHLTAVGYDAVTAGSGKEALEKVESEEPDLVLLDVMMPDLNGFAVCRKLRENPKTKNLPVLMISGLRSKADTDEAKMSGANDFIVKPVDLDELTKRIGKFVGTPFQ